MLRRRVSRRWRRPTAVVGRGYLFGRALSQWRFAGQPSSFVLVGFGGGVRQHSWQVGPGGYSWPHRWSYNAL